jgi:hypothetical protein
MVVKAARCLSALALVFSLWSCAGRGSDAENSAKRYIEALQRYDVEALRKLTAPDVVCTTGLSRIVGRDQLLAPVEFQAGIRTTYECARMVVHGDTVEVDLVETSDLGSALGIPESHHYERFVFEKGVLQLREVRKPPLEYQTFGERLRRLRSWIQENHPDVMGQIEDAKGNFKGDRAAGEALVRMARKWRESQPPE